MPAWPSLPCRIAAILACLTVLCSLAKGQDEPTVRVAFRAGAADAGATGIAWLCDTYLPSRPEWPADLPAGAAFLATLSKAGLRIEATQIPLPEGTLAAGSLQLGDGPLAFGACTEDGIEDWYVPRSMQLPTTWLSALRELDADLLAQPRTLDAAALSGHLTGPAPDGDPNRSLAQLGAMCGEVTFTAWHAGDHLRVRGRSDGGLLLPALLIATLQKARPVGLAAVSLRAFAARDGDRTEAARQLVGTEPQLAKKTLRALLLGNDELRLTAIDTLVRRRASEELPRIVGAAIPAMPLASAAAADALRSLWIEASPAVRQQTRAALARCQVMDLRRLDTDSLATRILPGAPEHEETPDAYARWLLALLLCGIALYGLWLRERTRLHGAAA